MDYNAIIAGAVTFVLGIAAVKTFLGKFLPQTVKYVGLAKDALVLIDDVIDALKDGQLTPEEIGKLKSDVAEIKAELAK